LSEQNKNSQEFSKKKKKTLKLGELLDCQELNKRPLIKQRLDVSTLTLISIPKWLLLRNLKRVFDDDSNCNRSMYTTNL
jgi:hypothetical protein